MSIFVSSTLSVSRKEYIDCKEMVVFLSKYNIITSVSENLSSTPKLENGCKLIQSISSKNDLEKMWNLLKNKYDFKCAHLKIDGHYDGCILNYLRPSICPTSE
jgi:hypothetical protein